jgi:hypothetical protein
MRDPIPAVDKPATVKEIPNSLFPKLQAVTKSPTNVSIAPRAHVSKGVPISYSVYIIFKVFVNLAKMIKCSTQTH